MKHIFLYGPPGTGKSTVGKKLAHNLKLPFIDLDRVIETNAGKSIPQIMEKQGETAFRDLESAALKKLLHEKESIVALGGGALLRDENRNFVESNGQVLLLMAELSTLLERLHYESGNRPLLAGDLREKLSSLLNKRGEHYNSFPMLIHVDGKTAEQNAHHAQVVLGRHHLSAMGEYDAIVGQGFRPGETSPCKIPSLSLMRTWRNFISKRCKTSCRRRPSLSLLGKNIKIWKLFHFCGNPSSKTDWIVKARSLPWAVGCSGDMAGFAASTYMRGISWVGVPTTLLSMVDASLGGKTGFDLPEGKNLIGAFYPPKLVLADPQLLGTLPEAELISGMAEVVKHGIISDPELFNLCLRGLDWVKNNLEEVVKRAMAVKIKVIEEDPYEKGIRAALNLGHTVGHAVELVSKFKLRHGEAIAIGTVAEAKYAARVGLAGDGLVEAVTESFKSLGLPIQIPEAMPREEIIRAMRVDKKKTAKAIRFALPVEIGKVELVEVTDLESVLDDGQ